MIEQLLEHSGWARRLAAGLVSDASRADDVVQDAWVAALTRPPIHANNLRSWFAFLVKRAARRSARGESRRALRDLAAAKPEAVPAADALERAELQRTLVEAVLALREPYKTAIVLAYFEDLSPRKIAARLDLPDSTVRSHVRRGLALLREELEGRTEVRGSLLPAISALARSPSGSSTRPWPTSAASTGGLIVMTKSKVVAVLFVVAAAGALLWLRGSAVPGGSTATDERSPDLALSLPPKGDGLQLPDAEPSRSEAAVESAAPANSSASASDDDTALLRGRVVDGKSTPVPGASVRVLRSEARMYSYFPDMEYLSQEREIAETRSDANGEFSVRLQVGRANDLRVRSPAFAERQMSGLRAGETILVTLQPAAVLTGIVKRISDGAPIAGALLVIESDDGYEPMWQGKTDIAGRYRAEGLDAGAAYVLVIPDEQRSKYFELVLKEGEQLVQDFEISDGGTVEGVVRDRTSEMPIAGAEVSAWSFLHQTARTDGAGHFVLHGLKGILASVPIQARAEGYGLLEMRVSAKESETVHVAFDLLPALAARGRVVTRRGTPVAGAYVAVIASAFDPEQKLSRGDCRPARSAEDGTFELRNLRPDLPHALFLRKEGFATTVVDFGDREKPAAVHATSVELGDVVLPAMSSLSGTIVDAEGKGIAGAEVEFHEERPNDRVQTEAFTMQSAPSDDEGRFRLLDLPSGRLRLTATKPGLPAIEGLEIELAEGEARRGFVIQMGGGLSLRGRVLDPEGGGAQGARVYVSGGSLSTTTWHHAVAESDGSFLFSGLASGEYKLRAEPTGDGSVDGRDDWMASSLESVRAGASDVVLQLRHGVAVEGRLSTPDGSAPVRAWIVAVEATGARASWTATDEKGVFRLQAASGTSVELRIWIARPDPQYSSGFSADETTRPIVVVPGVLAGTKDLLVPVPR